MSIDDQISDAVSRGRAFPILPVARGAPVRRALFVGEALWTELDPADKPPEWQERIATLRADLEVFVTAAQITPKYLFLLYKSVEAVWEIRSVRDDPSLRVLGLFARRDVLFLSVMARREDLGDWQSRAWKTVKSSARAEWRRLFNTYLPVRTTNVADVCTGTIHGIYYKERNKDAL